jgi:hypothetical protein
MGRRRRVALLVVATVGLVTATGGYTAVTGDRTVGVGVVDDDNAYVGFTDEEPPVSPGEKRQATVLEVRNRFGATASVTVRVDDSTGPVSLSLPDDPLSVDSGAVVPVEGTVACAESANAPLSVSVSVTLSVDSEDAGVRAEITRQVTVRCERPQTTTETTTTETTTTETTTETTTATSTETATQTATTTETATSTKTATSTQTPTETDTES